MSDTFEVGDKVQVRAVRGRSSFIGVIVLKEKNGRKNPELFFHVRDAHGRDWHRSSQEISHVEEWLA